MKNQLDQMRDHYKLMEDHMDALWLAINKEAVDNINRESREIKQLSAVLGEMAYEIRA